LVELLKGCSTESLIGEIEKIAHYATHYRENNGSLSSFPFFLAHRKVLRRPLCDSLPRDCTDHCHALPAKAPPWTR
jgi:hypothetical protein